MIEELDLYQNTTDPYIIAEVGSNWKGKSRSQDLANCLDCCHLVKEYGADAIKFQLFTHKELYGKDGDDTFALPRSFVSKIAYKAQDLGLDFLCSAFSVDGFKFLDPFVKMHKVAASSVGDPDIDSYLKTTSKMVLKSDGMFSIDPAADLTIPLLCASNYPAMPWDYDMFKMFEYAVRNQNGWGISDHTDGLVLAKMARCNGASFFEKHVNPMDIRDTPDYLTSMRLETFGLYTEGIRKSVVKNPIMVQEQARNKWGDRWDDELKGYYRPS